MNTCTSTNRGCGPGGGPGLHLARSGGVSWRGAARGHMLQDECVAGGYGRKAAVSFVNLWFISEDDKS